MSISTRLDLRPLVSGDLPHLLRWRNDPEVVRHLAQTSATMEQLETWLASQRPEAGDRFYAIVDSGALIGYCMLNGVDAANRRCEAGIVIGEQDRWGEGIGARVARALAHIAFTELDLHRVAAVASEKNTGSIRTFTKAGYREEGRMREARRLDGGYVDLVLMSMLAHELPPLREGEPEVRVVK